MLPVFLDVMTENVREGSVSSFRDGVREAAPIVFGYLPIGFAYGVLGAAVGVPLWVIAGMSVIVYAGSAQFLAASLIGQGAGIATLVMTTFLVNLRHVLYGTALSPYLSVGGRGRLAWIAAQLTDESFVMSTRAARGRLASLPFPFMAGLQVTSQLAWITGSVAGGLVGGLVGDPLRLGIDYALIAMFVALLALQIHGRRELSVAAGAGAVSLVFHLLGQGTLGVIVATLAASGLGLGFAGKDSAEELTLADMEGELP
ncbi:MAG: AzlC family ABC transporter permease [Thermoleophilia bacterium]